MEVGARTHGRAELDAGCGRADAARAAADLPDARGAEDRRTPGAGPIDVSPTHLPAIVTLQGGRAWAAFGYTGNGVGPSHLAGRSLAALALGREEDAARWAWIDPPPKIVPPEPLRAAGATVHPRRDRPQGSSWRRPEGGPTRSREGSPRFLR